MPFIATRKERRLITVSTWPKADQEMRSAWHFLRKIGVVTGPFNRSQLVRAGIQSILHEKEQAAQKAAGAA